MDFKVRCLMSFSDDIAKGKIYEIQDGYFCFDDGDKAGPYKSFKELEKHFGSKFELVTDRPRICEVLGNGKPLEINEKFGISGTPYKYRISSNGRREGFYDNEWSAVTNESTLLNVINHPEKIIRQPQFSEDEKGLMRLYVGTGFSWFARDKSGGIEAYEVEPDKEPIRFVQNDWDDEHTKLLSKFLPQITWENSPFDAKGYLEGLK